MSEPKRTHMNLTGGAAEIGVPVTSRSSAVQLIDEGNALEAQGRTAEAMTRYDAAVRADPECARAHLNRGLKNVSVTALNISACLMRLTR